jgi:peptide/nickel transport system ATP-binding protein
VERGEVLGLVGASGCGKSTVVAALAGLLPPTAATSVDRLSLDGLDLRTLDERGWQGIRRRRIGLVPQQPMTALTPTVGVGRQLDWYLGPRAVERHEQALRDLGLDTVVDRPADLPSRFSGGQLQRLLIAVNTLDGHPDLFLADEPTSTLDATVQGSILEHLAALRADHDMAMVLVSHDLAVVARLADRVGVVHRGALVELAPVDALFGDPTHEVTRALVRSSPRRGPSHAARPTTTAPPDTSAAPPTSVLEVDHLYHYYGGAHGSRSRPPGRVVRAVDDVSLTVGVGEVVAVVGESGSGKSTVARTVVGALVPTAGTIRLDGRDVTTERTLADRRHVQLVTQNPRAALNRRRRVGHALEQAQRVHGLGGDDRGRRRASARLLDLVHLPASVLDRRPSELSGGELARVVLARALLLEPRLLLLDEPTASLDAQVKAAVLEVIAEMCERVGVATVIITHELSTARVVADRVVVMQEGRVVESGPVGAVLEHPTHDYTRTLLASELVLEPRG